jgi:hypothetical protein
MEDKSLVGCIGFSTSGSWVSKVIMWFRSRWYSGRKAKFSHCFVVFGELDGKILIGEAMEFGVRVSPLDVCLNEDTRVEIWNPLGMVVDEKRKLAAMQKVMGMTGRMYGYFQLLGFIWMWLWWRIFKRVKQNPFTDGVICSEYVFYYLKACGYNGLGDNPDCVAPDDIYEKLDGGLGELIAVSPYGTEKIVGLEKVK